MADLKKQKASSRQRTAKNVPSEAAKQQASASHRLLIWSTVILAVAVGGYGIWWYLDARETARQRTMAANSLHNIGLAIHEYHDTHRHFPEASTMVDGKPGLSWRVHLLPYLEGISLYQEFHLDEPWDSAHNIQLVDRMPRYFESPGFDLAAGMTCFVAPTGPGTIWRNADPDQGEESFFAMRDITEPTEQVGAVMEAPADMAVIWTKPDEISLDDPRLKASRPGIMQTATAAASVHHIKAADITPQRLREYFNPADGKSGGQTSGR